MKNTIPIEALSELSTNPIGLCQLIIPGVEFIELDMEAKQLFLPEPGTADYIAAFPTEAESSVIECIIAFCEIALVMGNPKYEITEQTKLNCNLFKLVKSSKHFSILIEIQYPDVEEKYHEILTFEELSQKDGCYRFRLLGDKSMFQVAE